MNNSALNCVASSEGESPDRRIVTGKTHLSLRRKASLITTTKHYDWPLINSRDIRDRYTLTLSNKFQAHQEISETPTPNDEYNSFVNAHLEASAECITTKQRAKPRVPWETLAVRKKRADVKTASKCNWVYPTYFRILKLKKAQNELANIYLKEQTECIQNQINTIRDSIEDRQSRIAWQTVNEMSRRKSTAKAKLKAISQEQIHLWKQYFEKFLGKSPNVTHEPITEIISNQLDIKLGQFTQELDNTKKN